MLQPGETLLQCKVGLLGFAKHKCSKFSDSTAVFVLTLGLDGSMKVGIVISEQDAKQKFGNSCPQMEVEI